MKRTIALIGLLGLTGCIFVLHSTSVTLPDGTQGYAIHCNGAVRDVSDCMNEAARVCAGPYRVMNGDADMSSIHRTMLVSCGVK